MAPLANWLSPQDMIILLIIGVIVFGKRLPEVGRYLGKGIVEFKKGMSGLEDEIGGTNVSRTESLPQEAPRPPQRITATAPKFEDAPANNTTNITNQPKV